MTPIQICFIVYIALTILILSLLFLYPKLVQARYPKKYKKIFWKEIYNYALLKDYLLVNELILPVVGTKDILCDHILFGKKYIYLIYDYYFSGTLNGLVKDENWIYYEYNGKVRAITNPFKIVSGKFKTLKKMLNQDESIFRIIVLVNDKTYLKLEGQYSSTKIIPLSKLTKTIDTWENDDIKDMNQEIVTEIAENLYKVKESGRRKSN